jgi:eukaryotic-like serine/threonine-protein kinase
MTGSLERPNPLDALAAEYLEQCRRGESPDLEKLAANHPDLADEIRSLFPTLRLMEAARPAPEPGPTAFKPQQPRETDQIGNYKLLQQIGEGGMGTVYLAQQMAPVKRQVALKLIKPGMDSRQVIARFEAERQALAVMDHPNIAKVLDGGLHDGRLYFVMELVKGIPITEYCNAKRLTPHERLELFVPVCQAIQHAHQKGIIHRDIKPSNILVAPYDDRPVPKVIDFGLAKATGVSLIDASCATNFGGVVGTPQYMSPEQASLNNLDIDTRTDIYSLGVLLYELLTGSPPFTKLELERAGMLEILRVIREQDPPKPSTRLSTAEGLPGLSAERGMEPARLMGILRSELDWIVMKALEKDRSRRYETANGFAADIQRFLAGEPVLAHPPGRVYRFKKFVRKNRTLVAASSLILLALTAGIIGTSLGLRQATIAREQAEQRKRDAETNLAFARKGNEILGSVFSNLDPNAEYRDVAQLRNALRNNLGQAIKDLEESSIGDPLEVARMQDTLGNALMALGQFEQASAVFEKCLATRTALLGPKHAHTLSVASDLGGCYGLDGKLVEAISLLEKTVALQRLELGSNHRETLGSMSDLALTYSTAGKTDLALPLIEETLALRRTSFGDEDPDTLASMASLADYFVSNGSLDKALPLLEEVYEISRRRLTPEHPRILNSANALAEGYLQAGQLDKALPLFEETLALRKSRMGPDHPDTLLSMGSLGAAYGQAGNHEKALPLLEQAHAMLKSKLGPDHPHTLTGLSLVATEYYRTGRPDKALPLNQENYDLTRAKLGPDHPHTLISTVNLASTYEAVGELQKAMAMYEEILPHIRSTLGDNHPCTAPSIKGLAGCYRAFGRLHEALPLYQEALKLSESSLGHEHPQTLVFSSSLAECYVALREPEKALPLLQQTLAIQSSRLGAQHPGTLATMTSLASALLDVREFEQALSLFQKVLAARKSTYGPDHPVTIASMHNLATGFETAGQIEQALLLYEEVFELAKSVNGVDHPKTLIVMDSLASCYASAGQLTKTMPLLEKLLEFRKSSLGPGHPDTLKTMNELGACYGITGRVDQGIPLLEETLEILKRELGSDHDSTLNCMSNLATGYSATGRVDQAIVLAKSLLELRTEKYGPEHPDTLRDMSFLATIYLGSGDKQQGLPVLESALERQMAKLGASHSDTIYSLNGLARWYLDDSQGEKALALLEPAAANIEQRGFLSEFADSVIPATIQAHELVKDFERADQWRRKWMHHLESTFGKTSPEYALELSKFGLSLLQRGSAPEAEAVLRECLAIREAKEPDAWSTFFTYSTLGESLLAQKKFAEAEPLLLKGNEGLKARESDIPSDARIRFIQSLERLVRLYTEWEKPDQANSWKEKLAAVQDSGKTDK